MSSLSYPLLPSQLKEVISDVSTFECVFSPLERNTASIYGNLLRRMLLQYTIGVAPTHVHINSIAHEFQPIPGVLEETIEITQRLQMLQLKMIPEIVMLLQTKSKIRFNLNVRGPLLVQASHFTPVDFKLPASNMTGLIINPELHICTINSYTALQMDLFFGMGSGYTNTLHQTAYFHKDSIPLNVMYSPITSISYGVNTYALYDELVMHIRTNGSVSPKQCMFNALCSLHTRINQWRCLIQ